MFLLLTLVGLKVYLLSNGPEPLPPYLCADHNLLPSQNT